MAEHPVPWRRRPAVPALLLATSLLALLLPPAPVHAQNAAAPRWPEENWNPRPMPDDLVLPLPCKGAMAFRPVPTPMGAGPLADRPAILGQPDPETDYSEYLRQDFVAGPFGGGSGPPVYYLAKYEVTRDQYAAVTAGTCPELPSQGGRLPRADVAWHEALGFTASLSAWLARNAAGTLPRVEDATAFVRLPTEAEWEYATRGGAAVPEADFGARTFPMADAMRAYVWHQGSRSANGRARPVGMLEPNPLGLFDTLGNVAEWVLEPYRLNKVSREHGRVGGNVARGGDFQTAESQIRSSLRLELPLLRAATGEPLRLATVGFRPALGVVVTTSDARTSAFHEAFGAESRSRADATEDPDRLLQALREDATDPAQKRGLENVQRVLRHEIQKRSEEEETRLRSQLEAAAYVVRQVYLASGNQRIFRVTADAQRDIVQLLSGGGAQGQNRQVTDVAGTIERLLRHRADQEVPEAMKVATASYLRVINQIPRSTEPKRVAEQAAILADELRGQGREEMLVLVKMVTVHVTAALAGRAPTVEQVRGDVEAAYAPPAAAPASAAPGPAAPPRQRR